MYFFFSNLELIMFGLGHDRIIGDSRHRATNFRA